MRTLYVQFKMLLYGFRERNLMIRAASLAYFSILALIPLVVFVIIALSFFFAEEVIRLQLSGALQSAFGSEVASLVVSVVTDVALADALGRSVVLGLLVLIYGATFLVYHLREALRHIFGVSLPERNQSVVGRIIGTVWAVALLVLGVFLIVGHIAMSILLQYSSILVVGPVMAQILAPLISFVPTFLLLGVVYHTNGADGLTWRASLTGAACGGFLFVLLNVLFAVFLNINGSFAAAGATGALVAFVLWIFYVMQVILIGALIVKLVDDQSPLPVQVGG